MGFIIQKRRKLLGLNQEQLAARTHFSKYMISKIERGMHDIKLTELEKVFEDNSRSFYFDNADLLLKSLTSYIDSL